MRDADSVRGFGLRLTAVVVVLAMAPTLAFAYIDPGNGAYMVQALFALFGAALFYLRHPIRSIQSVWRWMFSRSKEESDKSEGVDTAPSVHSAVNPAEPPSAPLQERS